MRVTPSLLSTLGLEVSLHVPGFLYIKIVESRFLTSYNNVHG